jgi:hypothetical protein
MGCGTLTVFLCAMNRSAVGRAAGIIESLFQV